MVRPVDQKGIEDRVRAICMALPGVTEKLSHGAPAFSAGKQFVQLWAGGHHDHTFPHVWCAAPPGAQEAHVAAEPDRFFRPPYVGHRGWIGVRLDDRVSWRQVEDLCKEAWRGVASPTLLAVLDGPDAP